MADQQLAELHAAKGRLLASFTSTPYPPTGLATSDQALANAVELLEWCTALTADAVRERADLSDASPSARRLLGAASTALRDAASALGGGPARPDVDALIRGRDEALAVLDHLQDSPEGFRPAAQVSFHAHAISLAVLGIADEILVAARLVDPEWLESRRRRWYSASNAAARTARRVSSVVTAAHTHATVRAVWFVNSLRGAVALAAAVAIADIGSVQHGFWVVLGTLSVLRTNAGSTGATALRGDGRDRDRLRGRWGAATGDRQRLDRAVGRVAFRRARRRVRTGDGTVRGRPGRVHGHRRGPVQPARARRMESRRCPDRGRGARLRGQRCRRASVLAAGRVRGGR